MLVNNNLHNSEMNNLKLSLVTNLHEYFDQKPGKGHLNKTYSL